MDTSDVVTRYYEYANAGDWDRWCDLFAADTVVDEQLAGRVEGRDTLRSMMAGFPQMYAAFSNEPRSVIVSDGQAAVVSHISARSSAGEPVEAEVANYFRVVDGEIAYMANFHDTVPFRPVTGAEPVMEEFDYVIVGSGAAGSVLADRLSADPDVSVLVLEAGGDWIPDAVEDPSLWFTLLGSQVDWGYTSVPQPGLGGRCTFEPRGRMPGGSSNLYIMMHVRGHPSDFDSWAYQGAAGWSHADLAPYFARLEAQEDPFGAGSGTAGPQTVTHAGRHDPNPLSRTFIDACVELGHPETPDFNGPDMIGTGWHHIDVADGKRQGVLASYLEPALPRPNLVLRSGARATGLDVEDGRCVGVRYLQGPAGADAPGGRRVGRAGPAPEQGPQQVRAAREVLLCGGAIESPKLLMLSGIGDPDALAAHGIGVVAPLRGVGENFHNHVLTGLIAETVAPVAPGRQNLSESALFATSQPGMIAPDLQLAFVHVPFDIIVGQRYPNAVSILPGVVRPQSRGWIRLAGADPELAPLVHPNYLGDSADLDRLVQAVEMARDVFATSAFSSEIKGELLPGPDVRTRADVVEFVRQRADTYHHQAGSCRMGIDDLSVVDPTLTVHGVAGLRVVDASVMPAVPSGNCHTAIVAIAERAADLILGRPVAGGAS